MRYLFLLPLFLALAVLSVVLNLVWQRDLSVPLSKDTSVINFQKKEISPVFSWTEKEVHRLLLSRTRQKAGAYLSGLEPALDSAGLVVVAVYHQVLGDDYIPVITSGNDYGSHARYSKHYYNKAVDFRLIGLSYFEKRKIVEEVQKRLSSRYRVFWEQPGLSGEHLHVEIRE